MSGMNVVARFTLLDQFSAQAARIEMSANRLKGSMVGAGQSASFMGGALKGMGLMAAAAGLMDLVKGAVEFESAMANVNKVMTLTKEEFAGLNKDVLQLSRSVPLALNDLAKIAAAGGQADIPLAEMHDFMMTVSQMSVAFEIPTSQAADNLLMLRNNFKLNKEEATALGDAMNAMGNATQASEKDILNFTSRAAGSHSMVAITAKELAALGAGIVSLTGRPEVAARFVNAAFSRFATMGELDPKKNKKAFDAMKTLGITAEEFTEGVQKNGADFFVKFLEAAEKLDKRERAPLFAALFGAGWQDDMAQALGGLDTIKKALVFAQPDKVGSIAGGMQQEFDKRNKTAAAQIALLKNAWAELGVVIGDSVLGPLNQGAQIIASWLHIVTSIVQQVGLIPALLGPIPAMLSYVGSAVSGAMSGLPSLIDKDRKVGDLSGVDKIGDMLSKPVQPPQVNVDVKVNVDKNNNQTTSQTVTNNGAPLNTGKGDAGSYSTSNRSWALD